MHFQCGLCGHQSINATERKYMKGFIFLDMYPKWKKQHCWKQGYKNWADPFKDLGVRDHTSWWRTQNIRTDRLTSAGSFSLGQTQAALASAEHGVVMPDEDVAQDPHVIIRGSEAGAAAVGWRLQGMTGVRSIWWVRHKTWQGKRNTYLKGVSGGWEGEFLSLDVKGHNGH